MTEEIRTQSDILKVAWISSNGFEKYSDFASEQTKWSVPPKIAGVTGYSWGGVPEMRENSQYSLSTSARHCSKDYIVLSAAQ